jgi:hypothetical protein
MTDGGYLGQNQQQQRRPSAPERVNSQGMLSSFEQEIPVIKERMIEAGTGMENISGCESQGGL